MVLKSDVYIRAYMIHVHVYNIQQLQVNFQECLLFYSWIRTNFSFLLIVDISLSLFFRDARNETWLQYCPERKVVLNFICEDVATCNPETNASLKLIEE